MEGRPEPTVSVVIPNHNGAIPRDGLIYLEMVMETLAEQSFRDFEIIVVDDGSNDSSVAYLRGNWPEVRLIDLPGLGFSPAVNRGLAASRGRYVALLNNDVELTPDWLELLVAELEQNPRIGFATGKVMRYHDRDVIEQAGQDMFTCGHFELRGQNQRDTGQYDERRPATIVTAAAALYRREALQGVGGFDEDYPLTASLVGVLSQSKGTAKPRPSYCDDGDACLRMLLRGYSGLYLPEPRAFHIAGGTIGGDEAPRLNMVRNTLITLLKDLPASLLLRSLPKIALYQYGQLVAARKAGVARTVLRAYGAFVRAVPATLRKRRAVQRARQITPEAFAAQIRMDYPMPSRLGRFLP